VRLKLGTLTHQEASRTYDRIGTLQDTQRFYEDCATGLVIRHGSFGSAESVFEFGCGTGRFAHRLFVQHLSDKSRYRGVDVSPEMVRLSRARLASFGSRAEIKLTDGQPQIDLPNESCDRFVSNYVFDLLSHEDIRAVLGEAHRILVPNGLLCLSGLSSGIDIPSRIVAGAARWTHALFPSLIGGCRPVDLMPFVGSSDWSVEQHSRVTAYGVPSEVVVAKRR